MMNSLKVAELYDMVTANQAVATALPDVVDRLDSLQALHEQALQFSKTLVQLDSLQQKLESNMSTNQKTLEETKTKFSENLGTIQKNFDTIDQRLTNVRFMSYSTLDEVSKLVPNLEYLFSFNFQLKNAATKFCFLGHLHAIKVP